MSNPRATLEALGQGHVYRFYDSLSVEGKAKLVLLRGGAHHPERQERHRPGQRFFWVRLSIELLLLPQSAYIPSDSE